MFRPKSNLEGFAWCHQSITGPMSQRQFVPKCQFLANRPLGCCSFQNILTNPITSQINTLLLPYFISHYSSAFTLNQFHNHDAEVYAPQRLVKVLKLSYLSVNPLLPPAPPPLGGLLISSTFESSLPRSRFCFVTQRSLPAVFVSSRNAPPQQMAADIRTTFLS